MKLFTVQHQKPLRMKNLFFLLLLTVTAGASDARKLVTVARGQTSTAPGIGDYAEIGYAFAKGDVITLDAKASKQLQRVMIMVYPDAEIAHDMATKTPHLTVTMPRAGIAVIRFISDRDGKNEISYTVTRMPASDAVQRYNSRVTWQKPPEGRPGHLIPVRDRQHR